MGSDRKYSRVYHEAADDPKFLEVWDSDVRLALWVRLLVAADAAWPSSAPIPRSARASALAALVSCGLVDLIGRDHFRIHGMDAERTGRSMLAASAANARWNANGNADSTARRNADAMLVEKSKEENRRDEYPRPFKREFAPARPRHNTVDSDPLMRDIKETRLKLYGKGMDEVPE